MKNILYLFTQSTIYKKSDIVLHKIKFYQGLNNKSCFISTLDGKEWQLKIGINIEKTINNEIAILSKIWKKTFIAGTDFYIKEMIPGKKIEHFSIIINNLEKIKILIDEFHQIDSNISIDFYKYTGLLLKSDEFKLYDSLLKKYHDSKIVFSHNDINLKNIITFEENFFIIDYEWSMNNFIWFDIVNLIREEDLEPKDIKKIIKIFSYLISWKDTLNFLYINAYFAYSWVLSLEESNLKKKYLKKVTSQLLKIKNWKSKEL